MRFYKGDIVEVLQGDNRGNRYRIRNVQKTWTGIKAVYYNLYILGLHKEENIMLYRRPLINHIKNLLNIKNV